MTTLLSNLADRPAEHLADSAPAPDRGRVQIELSQSQIDRVVRAASEARSVSALLAGLGDVQQALAGAGWQMSDRRLSHSLLQGLLLLAAFPQDGSYVGTAEIARRLSMNTSTAHRYLTTLLAVGLLERDPQTRLYRVAPEEAGAGA